MANKRRYKKSKLPKDSRSIPLEGYGDDEGKWFRCWHCGFICKVDRDSLGGSQSRAGTVHEDFALQSDPGVENTSAIGGSFHVFVVLELGSDGNPKEILHHFQSVISAGCPLCGSLNWRGDY